jgi:hypothetical protein
MVYRLAILLEVCRFPCMGVTNFRSLHFDNYVRMQHFARKNAEDYAALLT